MPAPYISIVIPTYNRPTVLASCLRAIAGLAYPRDRFEVIVVDDGGSAPLEQILAPYRELSLKLIHQANSGPAAARNRGAREATGELLVFTDDDCAPAPDWLARFAERHALAPGCAIGGETENALEQNIYASARQLLVSYLLASFEIAGSIEATG